MLSQNVFTECCFLSRNIVTKANYVSLLYAWNSFWNDSNVVSEIDNATFNFTLSYTINSSTEMQANFVDFSRYHLLQLFDETVPAIYLTADTCNGNKLTKKSYFLKNTTHLIKLYLQQQPVKQFLLIHTSVHLQ